MASNTIGATKSRLRFWKAAQETSYSLCGRLQVKAPGVAVDDDPAAILQGEDGIIDTNRTFRPVLDVQRKALFRHDGPTQKLPHLREVTPIPCQSRIWGSTLWQVAGPPQDRADGCTG